MDAKCRNLHCYLPSLFHWINNKLTIKVRSVSITDVAQVACVGSARGFKIPLLIFALLYTNTNMWTNIPITVQGYDQTSHRWIETTKLTIYRKRKAKHNLHVCIPFINKILSVRTLIFLYLSIKISANKLKHTFPFLILPYSVGNKRGVYRFTHTYSQIKVSQCVRGEHSNCVAAFFSRPPGYRMNRTWHHE